MAKNLQAIRHKKDQVGIMIQGLKANVKVKKRVGGYTTQDVNEEVIFQQMRHDLAVWAEGATLKAITAKIKTLEKDVEPDVLNCKYGNVRGLPMENIELISKIELLELAIDEWGKHLGGWN